LSWQIVPTALGQMLGDKDPVKSKRVTDAMLQMRKIDIAKLRTAYQADDSTSVSQEPAETFPFSARISIGGLKMKTATLFAVLCFVSCLGSAQAMQDRMIDLGSHSLHVVEAGSGAAMVVFESGLGEDTSTWSDVQPKIGQFARTFLYDRAGLGKSSALPARAHPRTVEDMVQELHELLRAAKFEAPYVLVGHSLGGALIQVFARTYPAEVAGLVLVDPEDGQLVDLLHSHMSDADWAARQKAVDEAVSAMTPAIRAEQDAMLKHDSHAGKQASLPDVPVILLTGTKKNPEFPGNPLEQDLKMELHKKLLATTPHGKQVLAPNSRHYIQNDQPELVIEAVREVVVQTKPSHR
jgi:pimeloyl-ACP methyl ester carboxylesterase